MHILAVFAHPARKSFNRSLLGVVEDVARTKGHEVELCDLYARKFNPVLTESDMESATRGNAPADIRAMQDMVRRADVMAVIHPVWWFGTPAILKGWVDRVFTYGFAYGHDSRGVKPLLSGKKLIVVATTGAAEGPGYQDTGFGQAMTTLHDVGIFGFVGFDIILRRMYYAVPSASDSERRAMLEELRDDLATLM